MDGTVPQTGFLPGRNRQNAEKQLPGRESAFGLAEKRSFFANLPANRVFDRGRCDMAAFGGRFVLHVLAQTLWSIARLFCAKKAVCKYSCRMRNPEREGLKDLKRLEMA